MTVNLPRRQGMLMYTQRGRHTNSVGLCRIEHGGGGRDEREQLGVPPLVGGQIPPGIDHLKTDQRI